MGSNDGNEKVRPEPVARPRDKEATKGAILGAARSVLADDGFARFGINAVARRAGCDKQLIYRYFGGIDGVVDALGEDLASWVGERLSPHAAAGPPATYLAMIEELAIAFLRALREDRLMQKIIAWEIVDAHPQVRRLSDARSRALMAWMAKRRGALTPPAGLDVFAINAVLIGAIQHIALAGATAGQFAGLALATDEDWQRIEKAIVTIIRSLGAIDLREPRSR